MNKNRLNEIESHLKLLYEQRRETEEAIITAPAGGKTILKQQLRLQILKPIRDYEQEYWQIIAGQSNLVKISGSSLLFMLNQQTRCQDNILLTQKFRKFLKP